MSDLHVGVPGNFYEGRKGSLSPVNGILFLILLACLLGGCSSLPRNPVPLNEMSQAEPVGFRNVRSIGLSNMDSVPLQRDLVENWQEGRHGCGVSGERAEYCVLVISGGGSFGSFGAGILNGWSKSGRRPDFKFVTGISTGALIAPFAFLGPSYDEELRRAFASIEGDEDIFEIRGPFGILTEDSLGDSGPLRDLIAEYVDLDMLAAVAAAHRDGKRLYIGTTNLDSQRFTVWDMGAIAQTPSAEALQLFRDVVLASASIPGVFPPVMIPVETASGQYDEMHGDGGVSTQFFYPGDVLNLPEMRRQIDSQEPGSPRFSIFIIRNAQFVVRSQHIERSLPAITQHTISTMILRMGQSDLERIYAVSRVRDLDFNFVQVPSDFTWDSDDVFDQAEMTRLYDIGYDIGLTGEFWDKSVPSLFAQNLQPIERQAEKP